jgi:hypothetical protein
MISKNLINSVRQTPPIPDNEWLELEQLAQVELTPEDAKHPIEFALLPGSESGWRAASPGEQFIRLIFDQPQRLRRIWLLFIEPEIAPAQEFVLRWSSDGGRSFREILRQQWNFSPPEAYSDPSSSLQTKDLDICVMVTQSRRKSYKLHTLLMILFVVPGCRKMCHFDKEVSIKLATVSHGTSEISGIATKVDD